MVYRRTVSALRELVSVDPAAWSCSLGLMVRRCVRVRIHANAHVLQCLPEIRESCATAIQAHWRGHCARQVVRPVLRKRAARRLRAAMLVQRVFRGFRVRIRLQARFAPARTRVLVC